MKFKDKISIRAASEEDAINNALNILLMDNKYDIDIERINLRLDGTSSVYDIYYSYSKMDKDVDNSHYEIERKFLVKDDSVKLLFEYELIEQSYIGFNPTSRIRKSGAKYYYTEKSSGTLIRKENEQEINEDKYFELLKYKVGKTIRKNRYKIPLNDGLVAELDIYLDELSGLKTVEVEFPNKEAAELFEVPSWFGEDITDDLRYKNDNIAMFSIKDIDALINQNKSKTI